MPAFLVDAGKLLAPVLAHEKLDPRGPGDPVLAEALAEETARQWGGEVLAQEVGPTPGLSLMVASWREGEPPRAVLLPESYWRRDVFVAAWGAGLPNLLDERPPRRVPWEARHTRFVLDASLAHWTRGPPAMRLAALALAYRRAYGERSAREVRLACAKANALPIGDVTFHAEVDRMFRLTEGPVDLLEVARKVDPACVDEVAGIAEKGPLSRALAIADTRAEAYLRGQVKREDVVPLVTHVPIALFRDAGDLSPMEALCSYLVDDPEGPRLTQRAATDLLGNAHHSQVSTHLQRARSKGARPLGQRAMTLHDSEPSGGFLRVIHIQSPVTPNREDDA